MGFTNFIKNKFQSFSKLMSWAQDFRDATELSSNEALNLYLSGKGSYESVVEATNRERKPLRKFFNKVFFLGGQP